MEAIKGRGLAGAQLTTSGVGEEGDMDQDPRLYREGTSELRGGGGLAICSAVCLSVGADLASPSFHLSLHVLTFTFEGHSEFVLQCSSSQI